jgi:hypothetical protein
VQGVKRKIYGILLSICILLTVGCSTVGVDNIQQVSIKPTSKVDKEFSPSSLDMGDNEVPASAVTTDDFSFTYKGSKGYLGMSLDEFFGLSENHTGSADYCNSNNLIGQGGDNREYRFYTLPDQPIRNCEKTPSIKPGKIDLRFEYADYIENTLIEIYTPDIKTFKGLSVGDNESKISELYGNPVTSGDYSYKLDTKRIDFSVEKGVIVKITILNSK